VLSAGDDYPIHQASEPIRHAATSDRNFYDRYYFNVHGCSDELFMVMGMGCYPNLGTQDAFAVVRRGDAHRVVRASKPLVDRMDTTVGPFRIEVVEPLRRVRFVLEPTEHHISFDLSWEGSIEAFEEPRQYIRRHGRVLFDSIRFAQTGYWSGTLTVDDETIDVTPDRWWGTRDRSWGIRPVGEAEPAGIRGDEGQMTGMWNYAPMQFDDHSILYICNEHDDGARVLEEAVRIWRDPARDVEWLGRPEHQHTFAPGTRFVTHSVLSFPEAPGGGFDVEITPLTHCYVMVGTGYGIDADWRHGMYQGPELVVQGLDLDMQTDADRMFGIVDNSARFVLSGPGAPTQGQAGYGLHEYFFIDTFSRYGLHGWENAALGNG
jgi:hypothetical protein